MANLENCSQMAESVDKQASDELTEQVCFILSTIDAQVSK